MKASKVTKSVTAKRTKSDAQRSKIARAAAFKAWKTMRTAAFRKENPKSPAATAFKRARAA